MVPSDVFDDEDDFMFGDDDGDDDKMASDTEDKTKSQAKTAKPLLSDDDDDAGRLQLLSFNIFLYKSQVNFHQSLITRALGKHFDQ